MSTSEMFRKAMSQHKIDKELLLKHEIMLKQINQLIGDDFKSVPKIPIPSLSEYYGIPNRTIFSISQDSE
jgi:hypothetical protein